MKYLLLTKLRIIHTGSEISVKKTDKKILASIKFEYAQEESYGTSIHYRTHTIHVAETYGQIIEEMLLLKGMK